MDWYTRRTTKSESHIRRAGFISARHWYLMSDHFLVNGYVKNVFDKRYITNNQSDTGMDVGAPLTFGVAVRYDM